MTSRGGNQCLLCGRTVAPGSTPPPSSTTVPLICAVVWAPAADQEQEKTIAATRIRRVRFMSILHLCCPEFVHVEACLAEVRSGKAGRACADTTSLTHPRNS